MIKLKDLDIAQGMTADHVHGYLKQHDVPRDKRGYNLGGAYITDKCIADGFMNPDLLYVVSCLTGHGPDLQAAIVAMNPRMRAGAPSLAALGVHDFWLIHFPPIPGSPVNISLHRSVDVLEYIKRDIVTVAWRFWPCDHNGNKIRWRTNQAGELI